MNKYIKKPVVIEAVQWDGKNLEEIMKFIGSPFKYTNKTFYCTKEFIYDGIDLFICTLEGKMKASVGDYIIKGVQGEFYPCKPDIFEKTYDKYVDKEKAKSLNRLTKTFNKPDDPFFNYAYNKDDIKDEEDLNYFALSVLLKLGKLEDLEEELGCPLEVVFKAIEKGIEIKAQKDKYCDKTLWDEKTNIENGTKMDFEEPRLIFYNSWCFSCSSGSFRGCVKTSDYQKTWWLKGEKNET